MASHGQQSSEATSFGSWRNWEWILISMHQRMIWSTVPSGEYVILVRRRVRRIIWESFALTWFVQELLRSLICAAAENKIRFIYALSPGIDIIYSNPKEIQTIQTKLLQVHSSTAPTPIASWSQSFKVRALGCDAFALLFDDIEISMNDEDRRAFSSFAAAQGILPHASTLLFHSFYNVLQSLCWWRFSQCLQQDIRIIEMRAVLLLPHWFVNILSPQFYAVMQCYIAHVAEYCESRAIPSLEQSEYLNSKP